jgi:hypothetical protein
MFDLWRCSGCRLSSCTQPILWRSASLLRTPYLKYPESLSASSEGRSVVVRSNDTEQEEIDDEQQPQDRPAHISHQPLLSSPLLSFGAGSRESSVAAALVQTGDFYQIYLSFTYLTLQQYAIHPYQRHKHRLFLVHDSGSAE